MTDTSYNAVGGYIFAGGFTIGMLRAGFNVLAHLEDGGYGVKTARLNFPELPIFVGKDAWPLESLREDKPRVVYGNPPCAAWSGLNGQKTSTGTWKHDDRINCTLKHFELLEQLEPDVWVWESVERAWTTGREFVEDLVDRAVDLGYSVDLVLFDGQYVGGNHRRRRFFFVATKLDIDWTGPGFVSPPTVQQVLDSVEDPGYGVPLREDLHAIWEATDHNENLAHAFDKLYPPEEREIYADKAGRERVKGRPSFRYRKMDPDDVAPTVVGDSLVHPHEPRLITFNEAKAFCGYPLDFDLGYSGVSAYDLLTRAVMPPAGQWFGERVREALDCDERLTAPRVRLLDLRKPDDLYIAELERQEDWVGDGGRRWVGPERRKKSPTAGLGAKKKPARRTVPIEEVTVPEGILTPADLGSQTPNAYVRDLLNGNAAGSHRLADEQIVLAARQWFNWDHVNTADVAYQRTRLAREGIDAQRVWYDDLQKEQTDG